MAKLLYKSLLPMLGAALLLEIAVLESRSMVPQGAWRSLEPGLELGEFVAPRASQVGDSRVRVLRIDPQRFQLRLLNASATQHGRSLSAREWCRQNDLVAAINASMFQKDLKTSVSLMRTSGHINNPKLSKDNTVLAFDPESESLPPVQIIDRECQNYEAVSARYASLVQSIRMVSCKGKNVWSQQPRKWSTAAIGIDTDGRVLFIHCRSPYTTHDFINLLLQLPIDLQQAMYVEGGPEAQLYVNAGDQQVEFVGSFETGFLQSDSNLTAWPIPNVVAVARRMEPLE